jgi:hypothetical protein
MPLGAYAKAASALVVSTDCGTSLQIFFLMCRARFSSQTYPLRFNAQPIMPTVPREVDGIVAVGIGLHVGVRQDVTSPEAGLECGIRLRDNRIRW